MLHPKNLQQQVQAQQMMGLEEDPADPFTPPKLKNDGWKTSFLLGRPVFRGYVELREGKGFGHFSGANC